MATGFALMDDRFPVRKNMRGYMRGIRTFTRKVLRTEINGFLALKSPEENCYKLLQLKWIVQNDIK